MSDVKSKKTKAKKKWNILYFDQQVLSDTDLLWGFLELGYDKIRAADFRVPDAEYTEEDVRRILAELQDANLVVTKDFSAAVAEACHRENRIYFCWVHDSPQRSLYMKEALYETNRVFVFDRKQLERMKEAGLPHVFYMPLAANVTRVSALKITEEDKAAYGADIAFVGNLYDEDDRAAFFAALPEAARNEAERVIAEKTGNWKEDATVFRPLSPETVHAMYGALSHENMELYSMSPEFIVQLVLLTREVAKRDRVEALNRLSRKFSVRLYTSAPERAGALLPHTDVRGGVSYEEEMPKVFHSSKINLNLTMPSIETGVPLRVFDIMSVGGFVMSNDQAEIRELFVPDREIVTFRDFEEMEEKAAYYLSHDEARTRIAIQGYRKIAEHYTCPVAVGRMLRKIEAV